MLRLTPKEKFESVKYRHEDQSKLLQKMSDIDLRLVISFFTLQLALGGFITQTYLDAISKIGLFILDLSLFWVCIRLLYNNYKRRLEAVETIQNCNEALGYSVAGKYIVSKNLDSDTIIRPWFIWYMIGIGVSVIGILVILLSPISKGNKKVVTETNVITINDSNEKDTFNINVIKFYDTLAIKQKPRQYKSGPTKVEIVKFNDSIKIIK